MKKKTFKVVTLITSLSILAVGTAFAEQTSKINNLLTDDATNVQAAQNNTVVEIKDFVFTADTNKEETIYEVTDDVQETSAQTEMAADTVSSEATKSDSEIVSETKSVITKSQEEASTIKEDQSVELAIEEKPIVNKPVAGLALTDQQANSMAYQNSLTYVGYTNEVVSLINQERISAGVPTVENDSTLTIVAMHRSAENAWMNWIEVADGHHIRPNGQKASTICNYYGLFGSYGENLGRYQLSSSQIVMGWHDSAAHYACMTNAKYTRVGIGVAQDSEGYFYWTAVFMD